MSRPAFTQSQRNYMARSASNIFNRKRRDPMRRTLTQEVTDRMRRRYNTEWSEHAVGAGLRRLGWTNAGPV